MIKTLTSLRFFFALMVFNMHMNQALIRNNFEGYFTNDIFSILNIGGIGVVFFFVLSGFVMTLSYENRIQENTDFSFYDYYCARITRIFPLHIIVLLLIVILMKINIMGSFFSLLIFLSKLFLLQSYIPSSSFIYNYAEPHWSLSCEMFFYFCFPFILQIYYKYKDKFFFKFILTCILMFTIPFLIKCITVEYYQWNILYANPLVRVLDFIIGILLYKLYKYINANFSLVQKKYFYLGSLIEVLSIVVFFAVSLVRHSINSSYTFAYLYWVPICFIILVFSFQKGVLSKILMNKIFIYLGEISFSIYLIHSIIIYLFFNYNNNYFTNKFYLVGICLLLTIFFSSISYYLIEKKMNVYLKEILSNNYMIKRYINRVYEKIVEII